MEVDLLFQHYFLSDSNNANSKSDSRQHYTKTKDVTMNWNMPVEKQGRLSFQNLSVYEKYWITKFLDT